MFYLNTATLAPGLVIILLILEKISIGMVRKFTKSI
jgi:hypothetical protein